MKDLQEYVNEAFTAIKAKDYEDMVKQFAKKYKVSESDIEALLYVVHSDDHIGAKLKSVVAKLQKIGEVPKMTLYRGCSDVELEAIKANKHSIVDTLSFSEDIKIAKSFGKNIIEVEAKVPLFCYHKFLGEWYTTLKNVDASEYDAVDGDYMIETAEEELEWICINDYEFTMTAKRASTGDFIFSLNK